MVPQARTRPSDLATVAALAVGIRALYLADLLGDPLSRELIVNAALYDEQARRIAAGAALAATSGSQPLYPYLVGAVYALAGPSPLAVRLLQVLLGGVTAAAVAWMAGELSGRRASVVAGVLYACFWPAVFYGGELLPDTAVTAAVVVGLAGSLRAARHGGVAGWAVGASCLALAALGKPNALLLSPLPLATVLATRDLEPSRRRARALGALAVPAAVVAALAVSPMLIDGPRSAATAFAVQTWWNGNHAGSDGINCFQGETPRVARWAVWDDPTDTDAIAAAFRDDALAFARSRPGAFAALQARKLWMSLSAWEVANNATVDWRKGRSAVLRWPLWPGFGVLLVLAAAAVPALRGRWRVHLLPAGAAVLWLGSMALIHVAGRFRLPVAAVLAVYAGVAAAAAADAWRRRDRRLLAAMAVAALVAGAVAYADPFGLRRYHIAPLFSSEALVLEHAVDFSGAEEHLREGLALTGGAPGLRWTYGLFAIRRGRVDEGLESLRDAARLAPDDPRILKDLGGSLRDAGRPGEALGPLERAVEIEPRDPGAHYNLALARSDTGDLAGAESALDAALERGGEAVPILLQRGVVRARRGHYAEAEEDLRAAAALAPDDCDVAANLGLLYEVTGRPREALGTYRTCPDDGVVAPRLRRLATPPAERAGEGAGPVDAGGN